MRLKLPSETLNRWSITLAEEETKFEIGGEFPELSSKDANAIINLMVKYISARRKGMTKAQAMREVFGKDNIEAK